MASLGDRGGLSDAEAADLSARVELFLSSWKADGSTAPDAFLPPAGSRLRARALVELVKADMERRARAGLPFRVETYLARYPSEFPGGIVPVALVVEEFRVRHRTGGRPEFADYMVRFPELADRLREEVGTLPDPPAPAQPPAAPDARTATPHDLHTTTPASGRPPASARQPSSEDILPADVGYRLTRKLGEGSFGEVFEALAPGGFRVAVKRILRSADHPASQGEVASLEVMKAMSHPFLIQTHAYWVFRDRLVIVMELADGSLAGQIKRHKDAGRMGVPPEELIPFFGQVAEALDYLHSQRVTHRDVKPENLLLLKGYAKVADFGLARGHRNDETAVVAEVGTPLYMAPEVWKRNVNLHSDQYSLAATYVTARLGRPLFAATTLFDLCYQHVHDTPDLAPLPDAEQDVLLKAMAKKPDERYPSCAAFAEALGEAVFPPPPPPEPVVVKRRTALWIGLVAGFGAAGALVAKFARPDPVSPPPPPPVVPPPPPPWTPADKEWKADTAAGIETVEGRELYKKFTRTVGGETLSALLVWPTPGRANEPPPFYMLRDKITNRVFKAVTEAALKNPASRTNWFLSIIGEDLDVRRRYLPDDWLHLPDSVPDMPHLRETFDRTPVLRVNAVQAILVAEELGGQVPTVAQWRKATGANGDDPNRLGPAGPAEVDLAELRRRNLALGIMLDKEPWAVDKPTDDLSVYGIHQLVSNGLEWADGEREADRVNLGSPSPAGEMLPHVGSGYDSPMVLTFARIRNQVQRVTWLSTQDPVGFRVVIPVRGNAPGPP